MPRLKVIARRRAPQTALMTGIGAKGGNQGDDGGKMKRKHRFRPGTVALRQIRMYQKSTAHLLPRMSLERVLREIVSEQFPECRMTRKSVDALQEAAEAFMVDVFTDASKIQVNDGRVTLFPRDIRLALDIRRDEAMAPIASATFRSGSEISTAEVKQEDDE